MGTRCCCSVSIYGDKQGVQIWLYLEWQEAEIYQFVSPIFMDTNN